MGFFPHLFRVVSNKESFVREKSFLIEVRGNNMYWVVSFSKALRQSEYGYLLNLLSNPFIYREGKDS